MGKLFANRKRDEQTVPAVAPQPAWIIGIIDDEPAIHDVTRLALKHVRIFGRPLEFVSAFSAKEGFDLVKNHPEMALVLLDVVMETDEAGLMLVDRIRNELGNHLLQIVLRTGQPGYTPEEEVILKYEINSYKTKSELTRNKLFTVVATGLRCFRQMDALERSRQGLRSVINAAANLFQERSIHEFASGVLDQIDALFNIKADSLFCVSQRPLNGPFSIESGNQEFLVVAASDKFRDFYGKSLDELDPELEQRQLVQRTLSANQHVFLPSCSCLYLSTPSGWQGVIVAENASGLTQVDQELLQVFCLNVALGLENAKFFSHLNKAAFFDELTGLYNRAGMVEYGAGFLKRGSRGAASLYMLDIDYFHQIIESLGYEFGNNILGKMARVLRKEFANRAMIARLHADVFAVLLPEGRLTAHELAVRCAKPLMIDEQSIRLGLTVGSSVLEQGDDIDIERMLRHAESALKVAKEHRRGSGETFDKRYEQASRDSMTVLSDLRIALDNRELYLVLQPKVDINHGNVMGYEALIRWQHPEKGNIPPGAFIPAVDKSGLYYMVDLYVARAACELINEHPELRVPISINISANSLHHETFVDDLKAEFIKAGVAFNRVELEVTENALVHSDRAIGELHRLHESGFVICLDDFGAGFSSLGYLLRLPIQVIKIDRAFISHLTDSDEAIAVLQGILRIGRDLNKQLIIEGVETEAQLALLKSMQVDYVQGFFFYRPLPVKEALALLDGSNI
ncbi:EAL domain-containing protein [Shewanella khirikhana]|uniref:Phytochrome-like protein cph2 n=1 Tax=Shewanella khirikhana TaxID=1965282 RepID=A0ABM7DR16_9GAMM|nr:EAL domain-containing protein [Shewanella khirikhana]AZQ12138.1 Phytochrome-like protein cph2 [Shewanella khirikhana]